MIDRRRFAAAMLATTLMVRPARAGSDAFALDGSFEQGGIARGQVPPGTTELQFDGQPIPFAADRRFLIAFDRDAAATAVLEAKTGDGRTVREDLQIAPRAWNISRLDQLPKYPVPSAEFEARRPAELARIKAARALQTKAEGWRQRFVWPATGRISTLFGSQRIYAGEPGAYHSGIDIALPTGTPVRAPADGVVILAAEAPFTLEGNLLMLDHGMGLSSAFLHLSRIDVREGDGVRQGQPIGAVGATGRATGPHLHWGSMWRGTRIDPLLILGR
ncbi:M23 family peptidase [Sphingomonas sp. ABOLD]|uniref:Murein DD-endopeptidase MepM/ murein hydrolase activator NlpD n=1 Tax=Sphingomonas trueperi TaxID=53317 RepID=A0A7X5Y000_9SPHN|nr:MULTISPECIES: M23 family metallopeptidase [Sphingomonas]NJB98113.1 murein DD-endopeptidase MepM/ murein hydrolase activator NlpD [Sphingomonas trueperi]RSV46350.1 M23 family peptidase [Sphingomonas sp. ABOLD]